VRQRQVVSALCGFAPREVNRDGRPQALPLQSLGGALQFPRVLQCLLRGTQCRIRAIKREIRLRDVEDQLLACKVERHICGDRKLARRILCCFPPPAEVEQ
jgi:hypothetical protein